MFTLKTITSLAGNAALSGTTVVVVLSFALNLRELITKVAIFTNFRRHQHMADCAVINATTCEFQTVGEIQFAGHKSSGADWDRR